MRKRNPIRFEAGRRLSKAEKDEVLRSLGDSYKDFHAPKVFKGIDRISGDPRYGYEYNPDYMYRSDITGRLIRHYIVLPDGRKAHPTEIFPNVTKAEIDKHAMEREHAEAQRQSRERSKENRIADNKADANEKYKATGRKIPGSYFAQNEAGRIVRVDGTDAEDVSYYKARGFKQITSVVNMAKQNASARKLTVPVEWQVRPTSWGGARWQHRQEAGDDVYDRTFPNASDLEWYLADRYGWKFARKVLAALKTSTGDPVGQRNPKSKGKVALKKTGRALKGFAQGALSSAAQILGAGAEALNPKEIVYKAEIEEDRFRVFQKGHPQNNSGWVKYNSHSEPIRSKAEARREAAHFIKLLREGVFTLRNPRGKHLPGLPAKAQREYEHVLKTELAMGRSLKRAKSIAAGKVRKDYARNVSGRVRFVSGEYKGMTGIIQSIIQKRYSKEPTTYRIQVDGFPKPGGWSGKVTATESQIEPIKTNPKRKPNKTVIRAGRIDHLDVAKVHNPRKKKRVKKNASRTVSAVKTTKRRPTASRQTGHKKMASRIRSVAKARKVATRRARSGAVKRRNAAKKIATRKFDVFQRRPEYIGTPSEWGKLGTYSASSAAGAITKFKAWYRKAWGDDVPAKYELRAVASNPHRRNAKELTPEAQALIDRLKREKKITYTNGPLWNVIDAYPELFQKEHRARGGSGYWIIKLRPGAGKKRNPSAKSIRKTFAGSVNGERDLFFPQGTPSGKLAKLGKLVSISTEAGTIKPVHGTAWLCADTKGKLHIGATSNAPLYSGPARNFGHVTKLEYESSKPHLGYGPTIWFHKAGEENGIRPTLRADGKGGLVFKGGAYRLTERGIEN